ncbi:hypothetical protein WAI453_000838 [Rhynchosporium graminicola]
MDIQFRSNDGSVDAGDVIYELSKQTDQTPQRPSHRLAPDSVGPKSGILVENSLAQPTRVRPIQAQQHRESLLHVYKSRFRAVQF